MVFEGSWRGKRVAVKQVILPKNLKREKQQELVEDFKCEVEICCRLQVGALGRSTRRGCTV